MPFPVVGVTVAIGAPNAPGAPAICIAARDVGMRSAADICDVCRGRPGGHDCGARFSRRHWTQGAKLGSRAHRDAFGTVHERGAPDAPGCSPEPAVAGPWQKRICRPRSLTRNGRRSGLPGSPRPGISSLRRVVDQKHVRGRHFHILQVGKHRHAAAVMEGRISRHHRRAAADLRQEIEDRFVLEQRSKRRNLSLYEERLTGRAWTDGVMADMAGALDDVLSEPGPARRPVRLR